MDYEAAMAAIRGGKHVRRRAWNEPPKFITLAENLGEDYPAGAIYSVRVASATFYLPWQPGGDDRAATDWEETEWLED